MSALRQCLKRPHTYLYALALLMLLAVLDSTRQPDAQVTAKVWVAGVRMYQRLGRPVTSRFIHCRFRPTCSEYSLEAVERFGIRRGLWLTTRRLRSCTSAVPPGTEDPVP
jgi:putative membrane protein insertion efficiency factor